MPRVVTDEELAANADRMGKQIHAACTRDQSGVGFFLVFFRIEDAGGGVGMAWSGGSDKLVGRRRLAGVLHRVRERLLGDKTMVPISGGLGGDTDA